MSHNFSVLYASTAVLIKFHCSYMYKHDAIILSKSPLFKNKINKTCEHCAVQLFTEAEADLIITIYRISGKDGVIEYLSMLGFKQSGYV